MRKLQLVVTVPYSIDPSLLVPCLPPTPPPPPPPPPPPQEIKERNPYPTNTRRLCVNTQQPDLEASSKMIMCRSSQKKPFFFPPKGVMEESREWAMEDPRDCSSKSRESGHGTVDGVTSYNSRTHRQSRYGAVRRTGLSPAQPSKKIPGRISFARLTGLLQSSSCSMEDRTGLDSGDVPYRSNWSGLSVDWLC